MADVTNGGLPPVGVGNWEFINNPNFDSDLAMKSLYEKLGGIRSSFNTNIAGSTYQSGTNGRTAAMYAAVGAADLEYDAALANALADPSPQNLLLAQDRQKTLDRIDEFARTANKKQGDKEQATARTMRGAG